jgi:hypothetical protein
VTQLTIDTGSSAELSGCERYRWSLTRPCGTGPRVCWIMCNPSTADAGQDDRTIRRCIRLSQRWGFGSLVVVNLFALRATDPAAAERVIEAEGLMAAVGYGNTQNIKDAAASAERVLVAWGRLLQPWSIDEGLRLSRVLSRELWCLGKNADGSPKHPLARGKARASGCFGLQRWP